MALFEWISEKYQQTKLLPFVPNRRGILVTSKAVSLDMSQIQIRDLTTLQFLFL